MEDGSDPNISYFPIRTIISEGFVSREFSVKNTPKQQPKSESKRLLILLLKIKVILEDQSYS